MASEAHVSFKAAAAERRLSRAARLGSDMSCNRSTLLKLATAARLNLKREH